MDFDKINHLADESLVLTYINSLYSIELLRATNVNEVTLVTAFDYGQTIGAPWKDSKEVAQYYVRERKNELVAFNKFKVREMILKLIDGLQKLESPAYYNIPVEPSIVNSIVGMLDNNDVSLEKRVNLIRDYSYCTYPSRMRNNHSNESFDITLIGRIVDNVFNTFTGDRRDLDTDTARRMFGNHRHEILDHKTYVNYGKVKKDLRNLVFTGEKFEQFCWNDPKFNAPAFWADYFKVLYKLRLPCCLHGNRLDRLFELYIQTNCKCGEALGKVRIFSSFLPVDVIGGKLRDLNPNALFEDQTRHEMSIGNYFSDSLVERYLITQYLVDNL